MDQRNAGEDARVAAIIDQQNADEDARIADIDAYISLLDAGPAPADDDDDDEDADWVPHYTLPIQNDEDEPPTRLEGEGLREFSARFEPYCDPPLRNRGESNDAYRVRRLRHELKMRDLWLAALTPADDAFIVEEMVEDQIAEDAERAAWLLANPQPQRTPEQLRASEAMALRSRAALAALDFDQLERDGYPNLRGRGER